jgi:hypothetical protein
MKNTQTLSALFSVLGFRACSRLHRIFGDPHARPVTLVRQKNGGVLRLGADSGTAGRNLFDKFHILRHLADAMDQVRYTEYNRVALKDRAFIKGQHYTPLSHRANLTLVVRRSLRKLLRANTRQAIAYLLKEAFGQLWAYRREG